MDGSGNDEILTIRQLHTRSRNALAREMRGVVRVEGEIKSYKRNRASLFLSLTDDDGEGDLSIDVAVWPKRHALLNAQLEKADMTLVAGMHVCITGTVTISKVGRLTVELVSLDIGALLGDQAAKRKELYESLERSGLLHANKALALPVVPLRVGLISSQDSDGYRDFLGQLDASPFNFSVTAFHSPVQGPAAAAGVAAAISQAQDHDLDVIAIVRGGGGELDAFDKEAVAVAVAKSKLPIWTGIGHTSDHAVVDDVAQRNFITPTACGQGLVFAVAQYQHRVYEIALRLHRHMQAHARTSRAQLLDQSRRLHFGAEQHLSGCRAELRHCAELIGRNGQRTIETQALRLHHLGVTATRAAVAAPTDASSRLRQIRRHVEALDPKRPLRRGYSLTTDGQGQLIRSINDCQPGDTLTTRLIDGQLHSKITSQEGQQ